MLCFVIGHIKAGHIPSNILSIKSDCKATFSASLNQSCQAVYLGSFICDDFSNFATTKRFKKLRLKILFVTDYFLK